MAATVYVPRDQPAREPATHPTHGQTLLSATVTVTLSFVT